MLHLNTPGERTALIVRKHWFILLSRVLVFVIVFFIPFILYDLFTGRSYFSVILGFPQVENVTFAPEVVTLLTAVWALIILIKIFGTLTNYYLDVWIITDKRVVAIDQIRFFNRQMAICRLERIQDIIVNVNGFLPTVLNFGDIQIETAGEEEDFIIKGIPRPQHMKDVIMRQHDAVVERENRS